MTDERTRSVAKWACIVLLPLVYVLSFGPAADLLDNTPPDSPARQTFGVVYRPLLLTVAYGPPWIADPLWYVASMLSQWE